MLDTIVRFFQEGGPFMYPIAIVLALGLAITLERFFYLSAVRRRNRVAFERGILPLLRKRDYQRAMKAATNSDSAIASIMGAGIGRLLSNSRLRLPPWRRQIPPRRQPCCRKVSPWP